MQTYIQPLNNNFNSSGAIASGNGKLTITFKDASANLTRAKRIFLRIDAAIGFTGYIHYVCYSAHGTVSDAASSNFFLMAGETLLEIPFYCAQIKLLNTDAAINATVYIDAYSNDDISGSTIA